MTTDSQIPDDLLYSTEHEWLRVEGGRATVGITDHAQDQLGDIVYIDLPKAGLAVSFMAKFAEIESVKVASEVFAPASGEVVEVNPALEDSPELVNKDPYGEGWLVVLRLTDAAEADKLLSPAAYRELVNKELGEHQ
ncbi:MAG: glycine cleavage system protein GcvH [Dehalococcoidia bacterium]|nr:glycine cleavage system protein GcvH [Dehalococcoidia bacterium]